MPATKAEIVEIIAGERLRMMGILQSPEGRTHPKTAQHFALETSMTVEQANAVMADLPVESPFLQAMEKEGPTGLKPAIPSASGSHVSDDKETRRAEIVASMKTYNRARGYVA